MPQNTPLINELEITEEKRYVTKSKYRPCKITDMRNITLKLYKNVSTIQSGKRIMTGAGRGI